MRLPTLKNHFMRVVQVGRYVLAKLRRAGHTLLANGVATATTRVLEAGQAEDIAVVPIQEAFAHRDIALDTLKDAVRDLSRALSSRSSEATSQAPYIVLFPDGITHFTSAPLSTVVLRYESLLDRITTELPEDDAARTDAINQITAGLAEYADAISALNAAHSAAKKASIHSDIVRKEWNEEMLKVYGALLPLHGKKGAERFFPGRKKSSKAAKASKDKTAAPDKTNLQTPDAGIKNPKPVDSGTPSKTATQPAPAPAS